MNPSRLRRLIAAREILDAEIEDLHAEMGLTGTHTPGDCPHPADKRLSLASLGDDPDTAPWLCQACGYVSDGTEAQTHRSTS